MKDAQKQALISTFLSTPEGRTRLAESMQAPLRAKRNYSSMASRIFEEHIALELFSVTHEKKFPSILCALFRKLCPPDVEVAVIGPLKLIDEDTYIYYEGKPPLRVSLQTVREDLAWFSEQSMEELTKHLEGTKSFKSLLSAAGLSGMINKEFIDDVFDQWTV
jgi:hypothetical protein